MRLLYVCSDFGVPPDGTKGASIHLRAITRALCGLGNEVWLLSPLAGPQGDHPVQRLLPPKCPPVKDSVGMLKRWLQQHDLDDTISKELRPLLYSAWVHNQAVEAARAIQADALLERLSLFGHVGLDVSEALGVPLIVEANALLTAEARGYRSLQLHTLAEEIEKRVLQRSDAVLSVSAPLADTLAGVGVAPHKIHVVPNGVDWAKFEHLPSRETCRATAGFRDEFVIGFCGSLKLWHGVDILLSAFEHGFKNDRHARLLVVGSGPAEAELKRRVADAGLSDAVIFTGAVSHDQVPRLLRAMDVAVAPFKFMDNFYFSPIKLFEYMAAGTCVVASRLGQIKDVVAEGSDGLLCEPDDVPALVRALKQVRQDPELRGRLGTQARQKVRRQYTWRRAAQDVLAVVRNARTRRGLQCVEADAACDDASAMEISP